MTTPFGDDNSSLYSGYSSYNNWAASAYKVPAVASNFAKGFPWGLNAVNVSSVATPSNLGSAMNPGGSCFSMPPNCNSSSIMPTSTPGLIGNSTSLLGSNGDITSSPYNCFQSYGSTNAVTHPYSMYPSSASSLGGVAGASDSICSDPPSPRLKSDSCSLTNKTAECDEESVSHPDSSNSAINEPDYK